jgi:hypothetical protein
MADYSDALGGKGLHFWLKSLDVGLSEQLIRHYLGITDVNGLLAPVLNFSSGNWPFRSSETNGGRTGSAFKNPSGRKKIFVCAWESELSDINRKAEPNVESIEILKPITIAFDFEHRLVKICH